MDKESRIEFQKIDCNCSDCKHIERSLVKRQQSVDKHYLWQKNGFDIKRMKILKRVEFWNKKQESEKAKLLLKEVRKMVFQFDESECAIHFGECKKLNKDVSFIPNICQLETQECFEHRRK